MPDQMIQFTLTRSYPPLIAGSSHGAPTRQRAVRAAAPGATRNYRSWKPFRSLSSVPIPEHIPYRDFDGLERQYFQGTVHTRQRASLEMWRTRPSISNMVTTATQWVWYDGLPDPMAYLAHLCYRLYWLACYRVNKTLAIRAALLQVLAMRIRGVKPARLDKWALLSRVRGDTSCWVDFSRLFSLLFLGRSSPHAPKPERGRG